MAICMKLCGTKMYMYDWTGHCKHFGTGVLQMGLDPEKPVDFGVGWFLDVILYSSYNYFVNHLCSGYY